MKYFFFLCFMPFFFFQYWNRLLSISNNIFQVSSKDLFSFLLANILWTHYHSFFHLMPYSKNMFFKQSRWSNSQMKTKPRVRKTHRNKSLFAVQEITRPFFAAHRSKLKPSWKWNNFVWNISQFFPLPLPLLLFLSFTCISLTIAASFGIFSTCVHFYL